MLEFLDRPIIKWALPIPLLLALAPLVWRLFRQTWRELENEAFAFRQELHARGQVDFRPALACVLGAFILLAQEAYGRYGTYNAHILPWLREVIGGSEPWAGTLAHYEETIGRSYWALTRVGGYLLPLLVWRFVYPQDGILDMGLRFRGLREHAWLYALFVVIIIPVMTLVARQPDFSQHYPINDSAGKTWVDFAIWEVMYVAQFFALEVFFRGWWLRACRSLGIGAIFCMVVPYAMIHVTKPYLEACGAIVAGTVLGSLSMRTGNIWSGFLVHATVAILMDVRALAQKGQLPVQLSALSERRLMFPYWDAVIWGAWALALIVLLWRFRGLVLRRKATD